MIDFSVKVEQRAEAACVLALTGEVDLYTAPAFERELLAAIENGGQQFVIDLNKATFIDSSFLGVLIEANSHLNGNGGGLSIVGVDRNLAKIFRITGLDRIFAVHTTLDGAAR